jgi:hypothetical protein
VSVAFCLCAELLSVSDATSVYKNCVGGSILVGYSVEVSCDALVPQVFSACELWAIVLLVLVWFLEL